MSGVLPASVQDKPVDGMILAGFGVFLIAVHVLLPESLRTVFVFTYGEPSVVTAWTAATLYDSWSHLLSNLAWYGIVISSTYALLVKQGYRRVFWLATVACVVIGPPVTKLVDYWVLMVQWEVVARSTTATGFSAVVSAFGGMLYVVLLATVTAQFGYSVGVVTAGTLAVASLTGLSITSDIVPETAAIGLVATSGVLFIIGVSRVDLVQRVRRVWMQNGDVGVRVGTGWVVLVVLVSLLFQIDVQGGRFVNVVAHGTGFMTGMIVTTGVFGWQQNAT
ncbi:hypothetical protein [Halorubrum sp. FL23]|uniref:hypothetical protein n=1 Tax=Halorubrum sp. FL23 TaxID=3458704 RepID=UPI004033AFF6